MIQISSFRPQISEQWDKYVDNHPEGTFFHLSGWHRILQKTFKFTCHYLVALEHDRIVGILPLTEQKSFLFGHALVSNPFCVYGGVIADSQAIKSELELEACRLADTLNVDYLELRYKSKQESDLLEKSVHSYFVMPLADTDEENLLSSSVSASGITK